MTEDPYSLMPRPREIGIIESVSDVLEAIQKISDVDTFNCFRGHASISWSLSPSIFRQSKRIINSEYLIVRDLVSRYPDHFNNDKTMFDRLVRMQHFGLPTRLLDVTSNPLVALYFAMNVLYGEDGTFIIFQIPSERKKYFDSDSISCICNIANLKSPEKEILRLTPASNISEFNKLYPADRLFQFIKEEKPHFQQRIKKEDLFRPYYVVPKLNNSRIIAQNGAFLAFGLDWKSVNLDQNEIRLYSLRIPSNCKRKITYELKLLGIDSGTIFPEIDRAAAQIIENYS